MRALIKVINSPAVEVGSPVYIITDSAIEDAGSFAENLKGLIANKHVSVSFLNFI
jgi:hypothetical protein